MAEDADTNVPPTRGQLSAQARRLAAGAPATDSGRAAGAWDSTDNPERAWADGTPNVYNRPDPATYDENARDFGPLQNPASAVRDVRPPPSPPPLPRSDLVWEPGSLGDLNALPEADRQQAMWRIHSMVYDLPGARGTLIGDPGKIGGSWLEAPFAVRSQGAADLERAAFARRLRLSMPLQARNDIVPLIGVEAELRALPTAELKRSALTAIQELATNGPAVSDTEFEVAGTQLDDLRARRLGDNQALVYRHVVSPWGQDRPAIQLVAISERLDSALADTAAQRLSRPEGRVVYRILNADRSPTRHRAMQVLTVQGPAQVDDAAVAERVQALKTRTQAAPHQQGQRSLRYSVATTINGKTVEGADVVPVASRVAAIRDGQAAAAPARPAASPRSSAEAFESALARWLPSERAYDLRLSRGVQNDLQALPVNVKTAVARNLADLTVNGPRDTDRRATSAARPASTPRDVDFRGFRPRYVGENPQQPTHQIIYRTVQPQTYRLVAGRRIPDSRPIIHIAAVLPHPAPNAAQIVADRSRMRSAAWQANLQGTNRQMTIGPHLQPETPTRETREGDEQLAERADEKRAEVMKTKSRTWAAQLRSATTDGPTGPASSQRASTAQPAPPRHQARNPRTR
ncbi:hypothetical protein GCM10022226_62040 [Sphaerisporangium flaviroseum]|uniref:Uncharacterized protein n=1 Tax=Sphaerisporangium flaviroseum TaxID=509199 RepID=A0ABP7J2M1_9ACTN